MSEPIGQISHPAATFTAMLASSDGLPAVEQFLYEGTRNPYLKTEVLRYEYFAAPLKAGGVYTLTTDQEQLVATLGFIPFELRLGPETIPSFMAERIYCAPQLRGTGLYPKFAQIVIDCLRRQFPHALLFGVTSVPKVLAANGFKASGCFIEARKTPPHGDTSSADDARLRILGAEELASALQVLTASWPQYGFLHYTEPVLSWLLHENPFLEYCPLGIYIRDELCATVILRMRREYVRVADFICSRNSNIALCVKALDGFLARNRLSPVFTCNTELPAHQEIARALAECGYVIRAPKSYFIAAAASQQLEVSRLWITPLWAPPFWAAAPRYKPSGYRDHWRL